MKSVYLLWHFRADDEYGDNRKFIGAYRTEDDARSAIERLSVQPGFRDHLNGFAIGECELNKDHWEEGFGVPHPDDDASELR
jgi:hypothetical protein